MKWDGNRGQAGLGTLLLEFGIAAALMTLVLKALGVG